MNKYKNANFEITHTQKNKIQSQIYTSMGKHVYYYFHTSHPRNLITHLIKVFCFQIKVPCESLLFRPSRADSHISRRNSGATSPSLIRKIKLSNALAHQLQSDWMCCVLGLLPLSPWTISRPLSVLLLCQHYLEYCFYSIRHATPLFYKIKSFQNHSNTITKMWRVLRLPCTVHSASLVSLD